jgi:hypothetical protein
VRATTSTTTELIVAEARLKLLAENTKFRKKMHFRSFQIPIPVFFGTLISPFTTIDALSKNKFLHGASSLNFSQVTVPFRKLTPFRSEPFPIDRGAGWSPSTSDQGNFWRTGLLLATSAALGGIAVAIWNRRTLAQMRQPAQGSEDEPG